MTPAREHVTTVHQHVLNGIVVAACVRRRLLTVYRWATDGQRYVIVDGKRAMLINGVALVGGAMDPEAKPFNMARERHDYTESE